jgi:hypothetical protein
VSGTFDNGGTVQLGAIASLGLKSGEFCGFLVQDGV